MKNTIPNSDMEKLIPRRISEEQIKDILSHSVRLRKENEAQIDRLKKEILEAARESIPEEWIISDAFSGGSLSEVHGTSTAGDADFSRLLEKYESYLGRRQEEKYRQLEARIRFGETISRVMNAYDVLPVKLRDVLRIIYLECGSYSLGVSEASERLEISSSTAARRRRQGMDVIRQIYESDLETEQIIGMTPDEVQDRFVRKAGTKKPASGDRK